VLNNDAKGPVVLVVEDEPLILMDVLLEHAGFQILGAYNADEANDNPGGMKRHPGSDDRH
jgi:hypothetical protein